MQMAFGTVLPLVGLDELAAARAAAQRIYEADLAARQARLGSLFRQPSFPPMVLREAKGRRPLAAVDPNVPSGRDVSPMGRDISPIMEGREPEIMPLRDLSPITTGRAVSPITAGQQPEIVPIVEIQHGRGASLQGTPHGAGKEMVDDDIESQVHARGKASMSADKGARSARVQSRSAAVSSSKAHKASASKSRADRIRGVAAALL